MSESVYVRSSLDAGECQTPAVRDRVIEGLQIMIPAGLQASPEKMKIINSAVHQLCKAPVFEIDWVGVINLAASINYLWSQGGLSEQEKGTSEL